MRNELRWFIEPKKAFCYFKKTPNSQEQKGAFHTYSIFQMILCILRLEKEIKVRSPLDEKKKWNEMETSEKLRGSSGIRSRFV